MLDHASALPDGLSVRPARACDGPFLASLYQSARPDLQLIDEEDEFIQLVVAQQYQALQTGAGTQYPNAIHYIIEKTAANIGALVVDFGANDIRIVYLAFVPPARGHGYGRALLQGVQAAAAKVQCPIYTVVWLTNPRARLHYLAVGFRVAEQNGVAERLVWDSSWPAVC